MNRVNIKILQRIKQKILLFIIPGLLITFNQIYGDELPVLIKRIHRDGEGKTFYMIEYHLDEHGKRIGGVEYFSGIQRPVKYFYDQSGNLIKELMGSSETDPEVEVNDYSYNEREEIIEKSHYFLSSEGDKTLLESVRYEYDDSGNLTLETTSESGIKTIHEYIYDRSGKKIKGIIRNEEQGIIAQLKYLYNENGKLQEVVATQPDSKLILWKEKYQYDSNGRVLREEHLFSQESDRPGIVKLYEYNQYGKKSREIYYVKDQIKVEIIYQYK